MSKPKKYKGEIDENGYIKHKVKKRSGRKSKHQDKEKKRPKSEFPDPRGFVDWAPEPLPEGHPLWLHFVAWVKTGEVVRSDLIQCGKVNWEIIWKTYIAGAGIGATLTVQHMVRK